MAISSLSAEEIVLDRYFGKDRIANRNLVNFTRTFLLSLVYGVASAITIVVSFHYTKYYIA